MVRIPTVAFPPETELEITQAYHHEQPHYHDPHNHTLTIYGLLSVKFLHDRANMARELAPTPDAVVDPFGYIRFESFLAEQGRASSSTSKTASINSFYVKLATATSKKISEDVGTQVQHVESACVPYIQYYNLRESFNQLQKPEVDKRTFNKPDLPVGDQLPPYAANVLDKIRTQLENFYSHITPFEIKDHYNTNEEKEAAYGKFLAAHKRFCNTISWAKNNGVKILS